MRWSAAEARSNEDLAVVEHHVSHFEFVEFGICWAAGLLQIVSVGATAVQRTRCLQAKLFDGSAIVEQGFDKAKWSVATDEYIFVQNGVGVANVP
jgi:hypothetical protein